MKLIDAIDAIYANAEVHADREPTLGTLLEEVAELARAFEGKHEDPPCLELVQIGGIVANMLTRYSGQETATALAERDARKRAAEPKPIKHECACTGCQIARQSLAWCNVEAQSND